MGSCQTLFLSKTITVLIPLSTYSYNNNILVKLLVVAYINKILSYHEAIFFKFVSATQYDDDDTATVLAKEAL